ncbi:MAG: hypothetical protein NVSMB64_00190 [Candidatus Velthaea sp.]
MKIQLPDFRKHKGLNDVRENMRATLIEWHEEARTEIRRISLKDLRALETVGLVIDIDDVETQPNGLLTYQGEHILLYIMQPRWFRGKVSEPKYHVSNCSTWTSMKLKGKKDRYVASRRIDGMFELDIPFEDGSVRREERLLNVCQNCLAELCKIGYITGDPRGSKTYKTFSLSHFFETQRRSLIREKPKFTPVTMPSANYTDGFDERSYELRKAAKWTCTNKKCGLQLTRSFERRFLHTHHLNGNRGDDSADNLRVLCLGCHANQPDHHHMKNLPDYKLFVKLFGSRE